MQIICRGLQGAMENTHSPWFVFSLCAIILQKANKWIRPSRADLRFSAETGPGGVLEPTGSTAEAKNWSLQFTGRDYWEEQGANRTHT